MGGIESTELIRSNLNNACRKQPIIVALTADVFSREQCMSAGMDGFLSKPITKAQLEAALKQYLP